MSKPGASTPESAWAAMCVTAARTFSSKLADATWYGGSARPQSHQSLLSGTHQVQLSPPLSEALRTAA